jgi:FkbH-like protein
LTHGNDSQVSGDGQKNVRLRQVSRALLRRRREAAGCFADSIARWEKFAPLLESMGRDAFLEWETIPLVDCLIEYLDTGEAAWRDLFLGERMKQLHWPADDLDELIARRVRIFGVDRAALLQLMLRECSSEALHELSQTLDGMYELVTAGARSSHEVKILLVGDCLFLDLSTFLTAPLLLRGITLRPTFAASKNPIELRNQLRGLAKEKFELICYSPYSYEFSPAVAETHYLRGMAHSPRELRRAAAEAHRQVALTLRVLEESFDNNVFVHTTANLRRHNSTVSSYAKNLATKFARWLAAKEANALLEAEIADRNLAADKPLVIVDERSMVSRHGEWTLAKKFYDSEPVHYTVMARRLAEIYCEIISSALLRTKKVIVLDLDNTLWDGVIGEGTVTHFTERQKVLQLLRQKGVVLAIASKNDAKNVRWTGAVLGENDFVAQEINWDPKHLNIKRIAKELNLKLKDFVFIDDRPDEREMVRLSIPGITCLDATDASTWVQLDWWARALGEQREEDRTQMYLQRRERQAHLDRQAEELDQAELLVGLGLRVEVRQAEPAKLARAAELINRTNQFNTCGSRVSLQELAKWADSSKYKILVVEAADKFGTMGMVSVMVLDKKGETFEVPIWVLSCRVFGFGIETVVLNAVSRMAAASGASSIRGLMKETASNQPCRNVYRDFGFDLVDDAWEIAASKTKEDPAWIVAKLGAELFSVAVR